jgi:hypothetical protein
LDHEENWLALAVAVMTPSPPERAFAKLRGYEYHLTDQDIEDALKLKPEMKYDELAEAFGVVACAICRKIKKLQKELGCSTILNLREGNSAKRKKGGK